MLFFKIKFTSIFILVASVFSVAQNTDSLLVALKNTSNDTVKCNILIELTDNKIDYNVWPKYNDILKAISESKLKTLSKNNPEYLLYKKYNAIATSNLGYVYTNLSNYSQALYYFNKGIVLFSELNNQKEIAEALSNIAYIYAKQANYQLAIEYNLKSLKIRETIHDELGISVTLINTGKIYSDLGMYEKAILNLEKAFKISTKIKNDEGISASLNNLGFIYLKQGNIPLALEYNFTGLEILTKIGNKKLSATVYNNIGKIYFDQNDYERALDYYQKSLKIRQEINEKRGIAISLQNIGTVYKKTLQPEQALNLFNQSLNIREEIKDKKGIASAKQNIGAIYFEKNDFKNALSFFEKSLSTYKSIGDKEGISLSLCYIGDIYFKQKKYPQAKHFSQQSLSIAQEIGYPTNIKQATDLLYRINKTVGNTQLALQYYELYVKMSDSLKNNDNTKQIIKQQYKHDYNIKVTKDSLKNLEYKKRIDINLKQEKTKRINIAVILSLIILLIAISSIFYIKQQKQKSLLTIQQTEEKERKRMAKDIHDDLGSGLSKIKIISEAITNKAQNNPEILIGAKAISNTTIGLVENMRDLIWALNAENTTTKSLAAQVREYSSEYIDGTNINIIFAIQPNLADVKIQAQVYRNIYFIVKETMQNIVKHAKANEVKITINLNKNFFYLQISDNGVGINKENKIGNGLQNMKNRALLTAMQLTIHSTNKGTSVSLSAELNKI